MNPEDMHDNVNTHNEHQNWAYIYVYIDTLLTSMIDGPSSSKV